MKIFATFVIMLSAIQKSAEQTNRDATLSVHDRLALLKYQIIQDIEKSKNHAEQGYQSDLSASLEKLEYEDIENQPITPINDDDGRKKHGKYHLRQLKTTTETLWTRPRIKTIRKKTTITNQNEEPQKMVADELSSSEEHKPRLLGIDKILNMPRKNKSPNTLRNVKRPTNIFYRRIFESDLKKHCSKATIHCTDLITPVLTGQKINITDKKILTYKNYEVMRLLQILSEDTSEFTKAEIYTNMYQISNLQIRLFQWDVASLKMLFNVFNKGPSKQHTWKSIKYGLKRMLTTWHMDFSNVTNLLLQARIFRPPCIADNYAGSTQSSRSIRYTKKVKPKCSDKEDMSGSCEMG